MAVALYMDHHVPRAITNGLRLRDVDVLTAFEDGTATLDDPALLDRAHELGRLLFTQDDDLLTEAAHRQRNGIPFSGVVYAHQQRAAIGQCIRDLEAITKMSDAAALENAVVFVPL